MPSEILYSRQTVKDDDVETVGLPARSSGDGIAVLQAPEIRPYDLILMDVKMPGMDGLAATRTIRKLQPGNGPRIVAITAYGLEGDREKCLEAGMDDYIAKPVKMNELAKVVSKYPGISVTCKCISALPLFWPGPPVHA